jgi:hypothetical protein
VSLVCLTVSHLLCSLAGLQLLRNLYDGISSRHDWLYRSTYGLLRCRWEQRRSYSCRRSTRHRCEPFALNSFCSKFYLVGTYELSIKNLSALGLATSGTISVTTRQFSFGGTTVNQGAPTNLGVVAHAYSGNVLSFPIYQTDTVTTWAFEFNH